MNGGIETYFLDIRESIVHHLKLHEHNSEVFEKDVGDNLIARVELTDEAGGTILK